MKRKHLWRTLLAAAGASVAVGAALVAPHASADTARAGTELDRGYRFTLPEPTGQFRVGTTQLHLVDEGRADPWVPDRQRELMVSVWYPAVPPGGGERAPYVTPALATYFDQVISPQLGLKPGDVDYGGVRTHGRVDATPLPKVGGWPVVLYSPGGGNPRALGTVLVEELASRGYVVVAMDHTYEAPVVEFPDGRVARQTLPDIDPTELNKRMMAARVADTRFVLDELAALPRDLRLDLSRIGMFGHSAGGFAAGETMLVDRRIDAGIDMDGSLAYHVGNRDFGDVANQGLDRPFLLMGAGTSGSAKLPHHHLAAPDWKAFWDNSTGWKRDLYLADGEHGAYTDAQTIVPQLAHRFGLPAEVVAQTVGTVDPDRSIASQRAYTTAFFDRHLRHLHRPILDRDSPRHPDFQLIR